MPESRQVSQIRIPAGLIDLGRGDPQSSQLPLDVLRRAAEKRLSDSDNEFLQYGAEQGDGYFRIALAEFLAEGYGLPVDPDTLFITAGVSSALDLLCSLYTRAGDIVFVEEPTYFLALRIFADHGLRLVSIPTDESGLVVEALEEDLKRYRPNFLYLIPTFQNPSGHTLSMERRARLLAAAQEHDLLLVADEVYHLLSYTVRPPKSFGAYADIENVISLGSFSKILAPGLRLGWLQANPRIIRKLTSCGLLDSGGGMNPFTSAIARGVIESGNLKKHIAHLLQTYGARVGTMEDSLKRHLPRARFSIPGGGYFFWLYLPGTDVSELRERARAHHVDFRPGRLFSSTGGLREHLRLSISFYEGADIEEGIRRLATSVTSA